MHFVGEYRPDFSSASRPAQSTALGDIPLNVVSERESLIYHAQTGIPGEWVKTLSSNQGSIPNSLLNGQIFLIHLIHSRLVQIG